MRTVEVEIRDGAVACPYAGGGAPVDVETCYRCPRLRAFHDEETETRVVCAHPAGLFPAHPLGRLARLIPS
ncbi:MAG TPA: hypothetical protein VFB42_04805 [Gaiellaceae bacterium]|nr:hypothetical protein [Gaiellaceae bacterium]